MEHRLYDPSFHRGAAGHGALRRVRVGARRE